MATTIKLCLKAHFIPVSTTVEETTVAKQVKKQLLRWDYFTASHRFGLYGEMQCDRQTTADNQNGFSCPLHLCKDLITTHLTAWQISCNWAFQETKAKPRKAWCMFSKGWWGWEGEVYVVTHATSNSPFVYCFLYFLTWWTTPTLPSLSHNSHWSSVG